MALLNNDAPLSAPEIAYRWLRDAITALPWDQEFFLSEQNVAEESGTSRTPVREALLRLEVSGLVRRIPHKGAYVPALSSRDIESMMEARQVIEEWAVTKITGQRELMGELDELLAHQAEILSDPIAFIECDFQFHRFIVERGQNDALQSVYESQRFKQLRMGVRAVVDSEGRSDHVLLEHRAIVDGIQSGNPDIAVAAVRDHLSSTLAALKKRSAPRGEFH